MPCLRPAGGLAGRAFSEVQLKEIVGLLLEKKFLVKTDDEYPVIEITAEGCAHLKGSVRLMLPQLRSAVKDKAKKPHERVDEGGGVDSGLFEELRRLRKQLADARGVPPFV